MGNLYFQLFIVVPSRQSDLIGCQTSIASTNFNATITRVVWKDN